MTTVAILGFFALILVFFYLGRNDFGLKPTAMKVEMKEEDKSTNIELKEIKS